MTTPSTDTPTGRQAASPDWPKAALPPTTALHARVLGSLDFGDEEDFDDARRGFIGTVPDGEVPGRRTPVWSMKPYAFLDEARAPDTVNPSLWRLARLNLHHGLFQVCERIYQVRGLDLANVTFIEGDTGLIVIDPLTYAESARQALALYYRHRPQRPVHTVIYSHSHVDHYGGVKGIIDERDVAAGKVRVIAPAGFMHEAVSENVLAGTPMRRRAQFQFGATLAPGPRSHVDSGLGKAVGRGSVTLIAPTQTIDEPIETHVIDGIEIVFQLTPESEAPAEMHFYFPAFRALNLAENATHTMHNLCPLRGAKARDALAWSKYLDEALERFVPDSDVVFAQHHWPVWGTARVARYVAEQRDLYRYLHDQTLRMMGQGMTPREIADALMMPSALSRRWHGRGYYGAVSHNVKAIYQRYMGTFDGNPATLDALPPEPAAARYVDYMGGADAVVARAREDFARGDYRWVVEVLNHVVFAQPGHRAARELAADAMEQLGYQAESSTWRNAYLLGARELRQGVTRLPTTGSGALNANVVSMLPMAMFFDYLAVRLDGQAVQDERWRFDWELPDVGETHRLTIVNGTMHHRPGDHATLGARADARIRVDRTALTGLLLEGTRLEQAIADGQITVTGDRAAVDRWLASLDDFDPNFNIVEP
ncbi:MAG: alkyl sulfatase dimerization domain-containing protein [Burkholderiaceae bacterium]